MSKRHSPEAEDFLSMTLGETITNIFMTGTELAVMGETIVERLMWLDQNVFKKYYLAMDEHLLVHHSKEVMILRSLMSRLGAHEQMSRVEFVFYKARIVLEPRKSS